MSKQGFTVDISFKYHKVPLNIQLPINDIDNIAEELNLPECTFNSAECVSIIVNSSKLIKNIINKLNEIHSNR